MTPERYALAQKIFLDACERGEVERAPFLDEACGGDAELREVVESLLEQNAEEDEPEPPEPLLERLAGRYRIVTALGKGGMGRVYQAVDERFNRTVALKELAIPGARFAKAFEREARLLNGLRHRALPVVTDYLVEDGKSYLVMDFVAGRDLNELTKERVASGLGLWPEEKVLEWADSILDALEYLASFSPPIVHRDIKPLNLKLTPAGEIVLLDFGLAKGSVGPPSGRLQSVPGFTPRFSPLEQLHGAGTDPRADVYSLGATLVYLLAGTPPPDAVARAEAVVAGKADPLDKLLARAARPDVADVLARALALHRDQRLPSARAMRARLRDAAPSAGPAPRAIAATEIERDAHDTNVPGDTALTLAMSSPHAHNLPEQMTGFIGRESEVEAVRERYRSARALTLTGPGGIGKTRLAIRVASELLEEYEGGVWFSDLSPLADPANVPKTVAAACGVVESAGLSAVDALLDWLGDRSALLVLDNCEHLVDACAALVERVLVACPDTSVLATSRERLGVRGEVVWTVAPLTVPAASGNAAEIAQSEAVRLFVGRARLVRPAFELTPSNSTAVAALCQRLEGIPLAIELAAARVNVLAAEQILARIDDRFRLLASGDRNVPERQRTLRAALDWSYALLSDEERAVLMRLATFPAGCGIEAAEAVCSSGGLDALSAVARLVDKSLVRVDETRGEVRYRLLETTRAYALGRLGESPDSCDVWNAFLAWALDFAAASSRELTGPSQAAWLDRTSDEHDNLRAALDVGASAPETAVDALHLATRLARFWHLRGHVREGRSWLERTASAAAGAPRDVRVEALRTAGVFANMEGECVRAQQLYEEALVSAREAGDPEPIGRTLANLAITLRDRGEYEAATAAGAEALELFRKIGDAKLVSLALLNLGAIRFDGGDEAGAATHFAECLELKRAVGDPFGIANALTNLAGVHLRRGELERARELLLESLDLRRGLGEKRGLSLSLSSLALVELESGSADRAEPMLREALALLEEIGDRRGAIDVVEAFVRLAASRGEWERVALLAGAAAAAHESLGMPIRSHDRAPLEEALDGARRALGAEAAARAIAEGRALSRERMIALAAPAHPGS